MKAILFGFLAVVLAAVACATPTPALTATPPPTTLWQGAQAAFTADPWWSIVGYADKPPFSVDCFTGKLYAEGYLWEPSIVGPGDMAFIANLVLSLNLSKGEAEAFTRQLWDALGKQPKGATKASRYERGNACPRDMHRPEGGKFTKFVAATKTGGK